ncbi:hypothetical protein HYH03_010824 [Edaphochlamys debaryana]|uniref:Uncharacterized protein n=1 Tax=Edaphochlamys debaryana TaxID=47281 RepID=A0A835XYT0_9CHLO|nr:hypothetical protein HYH03_010824 [Edaphochlamys debaryana]|eukprot:KAG2490911.1 hypothetical protein HYH03_010824 [Edaphochlamys debaryana]
MPVSDGEPDVPIPPPEAFRAPGQPEDVWPSFSFQSLIVASEYVAALSEFLAWNYPKGTHHLHRHRLVAVHAARDFIAAADGAPPPAPPPVPGPSASEDARWAYTTYRVWAAFTFCYFRGARLLTANQGAADASSQAAVRASRWLRRLVGNYGWRREGEVQDAANAWTQSMRRRLQELVPELAGRTARDWAGAGEGLEATQRRTVEARKGKSAEAYHPAYPYLFTHGFSDNRFKFTALDNLENSRAKYRFVRGSCGVPAWYSQGDNSALGLLLLSDVIQSFNHAMSELDVSARGEVVRPFFDNVVLSNDTQLPPHRDYRYPAFLAACCLGWELALERAAAWADRAAAFAGAAGGGDGPGVVLLPQEARALVDAELAAGVLGQLLAAPAAQPLPQTLLQVPPQAQPLAQAQAQAQPVAPVHQAPPPQPQPQPQPVVGLPPLQPLPVYQLHPHPQPQPQPNQHHPHHHQHHHHNHHNHYPPQPAQQPQPHRAPAAGPAGDHAGPSGSQPPAVPVKHEHEPQGGAGAGPGQASPGPQADTVALGMRTLSIESGGGLLPAASLFNGTATEDLAMLAREALGPSEILGDSGGHSLGLGLGLGPARDAAGTGPSAAAGGAAAGAAPPPAPPTPPPAALTELAERLREAAAAAGRLAAAHPGVYEGLSLHLRAVSGARDAVDAALAAHGPGGGAGPSHQPAPAAALANGGGAEGHNPGPLGTRTSQGAGPLTAVVRNPQAAGQPVGTPFGPGLMPALPPMPPIPVAGFKREREPGSEVGPLGPAGPMSIDGDSMGSLLGAGESLDGQRAGGDEEGADQGGSPGGASSMNSSDLPPSGYGSLMSLDELDMHMSKPVREGGPEGAAGPGAPAAP